MPVSRYAIRTAETQSRACRSRTRERVPVVAAQRHRTTRDDRRLGLEARDGTLNVRPPGATARFRTVGARAEREQDRGDPGRSPSRALVAVRSAHGPREGRIEAHRRPRRSPRNPGRRPRGRRHASAQRPRRLAPSAEDELGSAARRTMNGSRTAPGARSSSTKSHGQDERQRADAERDLDGAPVDHANRLTDTVVVAQRVGPPGGRPCAAASRVARVPAAIRTDLTMKPCADEASS